MHGNSKQIQFDISPNKNKYWITASILWGSESHNYKSHFKIIKSSTRKKSILAEKEGFFEANKLKRFSSPEIVIGALKIKKPGQERNYWRGKTGTRSMKTRPYPKNQTRNMPMAMRRQNLEAEQCSAQPEKWWQTAQCCR